MEEFDNLEFKNQDNEFNFLDKEYFYQKEYYAAEEKSAAQEEFFNKIQMEESADTKQPMNSASKLSHSSGKAVSSRGAAINVCSGMGSAVSAMVVCAAAAGAAVYSEDMNKSVQVMDNFVQQYEGEVQSIYPYIEEEGAIEEVEQDKPAESIVLEEVIKEDVPMDFGIYAESYSGTYDGGIHSGNIVNIPSDAVVTYGESRDACFLENIPQYKDAGTYTVYYAVKKDGYETYIGSFTVKIDKKIVVSPPPSIEAGIYNGKEQMINLADSDMYTCTGTLSAVDAGEYKMNVRLNDHRNYQWSDGKSEDKTVTWKIKPRTLNIKWQEQNEYIYDGNKHTIYVTLGNVAPGDFLNFDIKGNMAQEPGFYTAEVLSYGGSENYVLPKDCSYNWSIKNVPN